MTVITIGRTGITARGHAGDGTSKLGTQTCASISTLMALIAHYLHNEKSENIIHIDLQEGKADINYKAPDKVIDSMTEGFYLIEDASSPDNIRVIPDYDTYERMKKS